MKTMKLACPYCNKTDEYIVPVAIFHPCHTQVCTSCTETFEIVGILQPAYNTLKVEED